MEIEHIDGEVKGAFVVNNPDGEPQFLAEMAYQLRDGKMAIIHTGVRDELRGKGVARQMLDAAIAYARDNDIKIVPICKYARKMFIKHKDLRDVLA